MTPFFSYAEIPEIFYSYTLERPFETCTVCGTNLQKPGTSYLIEKAFKKHQTTNCTDVVFEYAICMNCAEKMYKSLSKESLESITAYFEAHVDLLARRNELLENEDNKPEDWLSSCVIKGTLTETLSDYQICAHCEGPFLVYSYMPYVISGEAARELSGKLSAKTLNQMDDFSDKFLGFPPEWKDLLADRPLILI